MHFLWPGEREQYTTVHFTQRWRHVACASDLFQPKYRLGHGSTLPKEIFSGSKYPKIMFFDSENKIIGGCYSPGTTELLTHQHA